MKALRIIFGFMLMGLLLGLSLPVSALLPAEEEKTMVPKTPKGDTVRMRWKVDSEHLFKTFSFTGEIDATYVVDWGDGTTSEYNKPYVSEGVAFFIDCNHTYSKSGIYDLFLFGVGTVGKK